MQFSTAGAANLTGSICKCCGAEVGADQPIAYEPDGDAGERPTVPVWCQPCFEYGEQRYSAGMMFAAKAVREILGDDAAATAIENVAKRHAAAMASKAA